MRKLPKQLLLVVSVSLFVVLVFSNEEHTSVKNLLAIVLSNPCATASSYTVTATTDSGGSLSYTISSFATSTQGILPPSGVVTVKCGESIGLKFSPSSGYSVSSAVIDGVTKSNPGTLFSFPNISADHTLKVFSVFQLYVSPAGSDSNNGITTKSPLLTAGKAQQVVKTMRPQTKIEIIFQPGIYYGQTVVWNYFNGQPIHFVGNKWPRATSSRPVFDGCTQTSCAVPLNYFLKVYSPISQSTNIHLEYLQVQRYQNAVIFAGSLSGSTTIRLWDNTIVHNNFIDIGNNVFAEGTSPGYAAISLQNTSSSTIQHNIFRNVTNRSPHQGWIHALYITYDSSYNRVLYNTFDNVSGTAVDFRNNSNFNYVYGNTFSRLGQAAMMDWYCDSSANTGCTSTTPECPSWRNVFRANSIVAPSPNTTYCVIYYKEQPYSCKYYTWSKDTYPSTCPVPPPPTPYLLNRIDMFDDNTGGTNATYPQR